MREFLGHFVTVEHLLGGSHNARGLTSLKQTSFFQSMTLAYSDHSPKLVCGFGSAKPVLQGANSTEPNLGLDDCLNMLPS